MSTRSGRVKIWLSDLDGDRAHPLTHDAVDEGLPNFSPDGQWVVYAALDSGGLLHLMKARISGGPPVPLVSFWSVGGAVSPDGRRVALAGPDPVDGQKKILVADFETGEIQARVRNLYGLFSMHIKWTPDGRGVATPVVEGEAGNLVVHPLDGGSPRRLTHFTEGVMGGFDWAPDGRTLALVRSRQFSDAVLITDLPATED